MKGFYMVIFCLFFVCLRAMDDTANPLQGYHLPDLAAIKNSDDLKSEIAWMQSHILMLNDTEEDNQAINQKEYTIYVTFLHILKQLEPVYACLEESIEITKNELQRALQKIAQQEIVISSQNIALQGARNMNNDLKILIKGLCKRLDESDKKSSQLIEDFGESQKECQVLVQELRDQKQFVNNLLCYGGIAVASAAVAVVGISILLSKLGICVGPSCTIASVVKI